MIKLVAFDMDGTILDEESRLSQAALETIRKLLDRGIAVASNSGRSIRRSQEPFAPWPDVASALHVGGYNGGVAVSAEREGKRRLLHEERLDAELFSELVAFSRAGDFNLICCLFAQEKHGLREEYRHSHSVEGLEVFGGPGFVHDRALYERCLDGEIPAPPKIMIVTGQAQRSAVMETMRARWGDRMYATWSIPDRIEIMPPHVDKSVALRALAQEVGATLEETLAIGDGDNDLPMLKVAGVGVLMGNAKPEVRQAIEGTTIEIGPSLAEEGFSSTISRYVEGV
jgi:Cof subfamily protein (haloacid dehalogenase superfamily)